ncbi:response regulator [bacterium]|nr:response regulator [bacterium]
MKRILIADASKASLVMTSEVFKDHFPGVQVVVARTSADALEAAKAHGELDAFIIDYDLPDRDGAYTAARLKKMFTQPILITAFDRPDVHETIDRDLSAFDDCLSWLKKPVKPELVVSLAQRFIEGKHRCQRRLSCSIPAFLEIEFKPSVLAAAAGKSTGTKTMQVAKAKAKPKSTARPKAKTQTKTVAKSKPAAKGKASVKTTQKAAAPLATKKSATTTTTAGKKTTAVKQPTSKTPTSIKTKSAAPTNKAQASTVAKIPTKPTAKKTSAATVVEPSVPQMPIRKIIPVTIDDVSLGGAKIRIHNQDLLLSQAGKGKALFDVNEGQILQLHVPPSHLVEAGVDALEKWQKTQTKELATGLAQKTDGAAGKGSKSTTLRPLAERTRNSMISSEADVAVETGVKPQHLLMKGEVRWVASSEMFTFCGLRSETINVSKKLFESMIEIEARSKGNLSPMVSPNMPRGPKLNA